MTPEARDRAHKDYLVGEEGLAQTKWYGTWRPAAVWIPTGFYHRQVLGGLLRSRDAWAMFEELLSDLGKAFAAGLLTGGAFVAMRGAALRALIEFSSAVDAVRCALDMQKAMMVRNAGVEQSYRIDLRVAVGLGDVIIESEDIYGHAVNVVARFEGLAAPGGICVSADIWALVR